MEMHLIAYDLHKASEDDYGTVIDAIKHECPDNFEIQRSVWIVGSNKTNEQLRDNISKKLPNKVKDKLYVATIPVGSQWSNISGLSDFFTRVRGK